MATAPIGRRGSTAANATARSSTSSPACAIADTARAHRLEHKGEPGSQPPACTRGIRCRATRRATQGGSGHWSTPGLFMGHGVHAIDTGAVWAAKLSALQLDAEGRTWCRCPAATSPPLPPKARAAPARPPPRPNGARRRPPPIRRARSPRRRTRCAPHRNGCATRATSCQSAASKRGKRHRPDRPWCPPRSGATALACGNASAYTSPPPPITQFAGHPAASAIARPMMPLPGYARRTAPGHCGSALVAPLLGSARPTSDSSSCAPSAPVCRGSRQAPRSSGRCQGNHCHVADGEIADPARRSATHACELPVSDRDW